MVCPELSTQLGFTHLYNSLISAAGIVENFTAHEYPTDKVRKLLDINVMGIVSYLRHVVYYDIDIGSWFCALEAARRMPDGGSVILIGSMSGSVSDCPLIRYIADTRSAGRECPPASNSVQLLKPVIFCRLVPF